MAVRDILTEASDTVLTSHTPDVADGSESWSTVGVWTVKSTGWLELTSVPSGHGRALLDMGDSDGFVETEIRATVANTQGFGLLFRMDSGGNGLCALHNVLNGITTIRQVVAGAISTTLGSFTASPSGTVRFKLTVAFNGDQVKVYLNELLILTVTTSLNQTNTQVGLIDNVTNRRYRNFRTLTKSEDFDIFSASGQSNCVGLGIKDDVIDVFHWRTACLSQTNELIPAFNPMPFINVLTNRISLLNTFTTDYAVGELEAGRSILILPSARGGTGFNAGNWNKGEVEYEGMISMINYATSLNVSNSLEAIIWHQGEGDSNNTTEANAHESAFTTMISDVRSDLSLPNLFFVIGHLGSFLAGGAFSEYAIVNAGMDSIAAADDLIELASASGLTPEVDGVHFDATSLRTLGSRYYTAFALIVAPVDPPVDPPVIPPSGNLDFFVGNYGVFS